MFPRPSSHAAPGIREGRPSIGAELHSGHGESGAVGGKAARAGGRKSPGPELCTAASHWEAWAAGAGPSRGDGDSLAGRGGETREP